MIHGIGTDIVEIKRIAEMKSFDAFANKILSENELSIFHEMSNIEVLRDEAGKPIFNALNELSEKMIDLGITKTHVSLADERDYATAFAILEI